MAYIPRGHVPLAQAVKTIIENATAACRRGFEHHRAELGQTIPTRTPVPRPAGTRMLLEAFRQETATEEFTAEQRAIVRKMAWYADQSARIRQRTIDAIQQELGDGDVEIIAVTKWGDVTTVPTSLWRTPRGEAVLLGGELVWPAVGPIDGGRGDPFVSVEDVARWRQRYGSVTPISPPESLKIEPVASVSEPLPSGRVVRGRARVQKDKTLEWMKNAAEEAIARGERLGREAGVEQCQDILNCTRDIARAAYKALPSELKRFRGKPAKSSSQSGTANSGRHKTAKGGGISGKPV